MYRSSPWSSLPRFSPGAFALAVASAAITASLADAPLASSLGLEPRRTFAGGEPYRVLSAPFLFPEGHAGGLLFTLGVQWFLGGVVERALGTARYVAFVLGAAVFGYGVLAAVGPMVLREALPWQEGGMLPGDLAVVVAYGMRFGPRRAALLGVLPVGSRGLAALVVGLSLLSIAVGPRPWWALIPPVAACGFAAAILATPGLGAFWRRQRRRRRAPHLRVLPPEDVRWN